MTLVAAVLRRVPVTIRIWSLTAVIGTIATTIYLVVLRGQAGPHVEFRLPWPVLAFAVAVAELRVVEVHFRRETHSFSLSEFPAVVRMFFLNPSEYIGALLVGSAVALIVGQRQRVIKLSFNLVTTMLMAVVSLIILYQFAALDGPPHERDWLAAFAATQVSTVLTAILIATVITVSGGAPQFEKLPDMVRFGSLVAFANTSLALLEVSIL